MSKTDKFMPLYASDYLADTMHLTTAEHGAYLLLIMHYWRTGEALVADDAQLARITRCTPKDWQKIKPAVMAFFKTVDGKHVHGRVERQLALAAERYDRKVERAKAGAAKRWSKQPESDASSMLQASNKHASSIPQAMPKRCQPEPEPDSLGKPSEWDRPRKPWPPDAVVPEKWIVLAAQQRKLAGLPEIDLHVTARMFANHYAADTQNPRTFAEFQAKWANWALKEKPNDQPKRNTASDTLRELARMAAEAEGNPNPDQWRG
jgi:uncharacterized protein YdaU (DUF1376 family)